MLHALPLFERYSVNPFQNTPFSDCPNFKQAVYDN